MNSSVNEQKKNISWNTNNIDRNQYIFNNMRTTAIVAAVAMPAITKKTELNKIQLALIRVYDAKKCICLFQYMKLQLSCAHGHPTKTNHRIHVLTNERERARNDVRNMNKR